MGFRHAERDDYYERDVERTNMKRRAIFLAMMCLALSGCSSREVFESEKAAKSSIVNKDFQKVMANLGPPDAVREGGSLPDGTVFSELWQYRRTVRENRTGDLTDLNLFLYRGMVVKVSSGKVNAKFYNPGASLNGGARAGPRTPLQDGKMRVAP
jgi:hypothetical protein